MTCSGGVRMLCTLAATLCQTMPKHNGSSGCKPVSPGTTSSAAPARRKGSPREPWKYPSKAGARSGAQCYDTFFSDQRFSRRALPARGAPVLLGRRALPDRRPKAAACNANALVLLLAWPSYARPKFSFWASRLIARSMQSCAMLVSVALGRRASCSRCSLRCLAVVRFLLRVLLALLGRHALPAHGAPCPAQEREPAMQLPWGRCWRGCRTRGLSFLVALHCIGSLAPGSPWLPLAGAHSLLIALLWPCVV